MRRVIPKQSTIIRTEGTWYIVRQQVVRRVAAYPRRQAQDFVGNGADLDADPPPLHLVHDVRVSRQGETVADALGAEQQGVHKVAVGVCAELECLTAVEEQGYLDVGGFAKRLELEELPSEGLERLAFAFLAY